MKKNKLNFIISLGTIAAIIFIWFLVSNFSGISSIILPTPQAVWMSFVDLCTKGYGTNKDTLALHMGVSMGRLMSAFGLAIVTAVPLGLLAGYFSKVKAVANPIIEFYRPLPPLAYYTLLVLWLGIGEESKITLLYLAGFAPIYIACVSGVRKISRDYLNGSYMLGASKAQTFWNVILPGALPDIFTGIRTAIGVEYTTLVAAEMVAAKLGIGWVVLDASNWLKSDVVFAGVIVMGITGILLNQVILLIERATVHWAGKK